MLSTSHKFLFVHVPKTAGNSIQNILSRYADDLVVRLGPHQDVVERFEVRSRWFDTRKHSTMAEYEQQYGHESLAGLYKFCCVRNPWDRAVSHYFSPHRGAVKWNRQAFLVHVRSETKPLAVYVSMRPDAPLSESVAGLDAVLRYESLQEDFDRVCGQIGIPTEMLPRRNRSERGDYRKYYDPESLGIVAERFADEIELFGYTFD